MAFADRLYRKRNPLDAIIGFAGGNLQDQLNREGAIPREALEPQQPAPTTMADRYMAQAVPVEPQSNPFQDRLMRPRRTQPRDVIADDAQNLSDLQGKPLGVRGKLGLVAQNIATNLGATPLQTRRQRDIAKAAGQLETDLGVAKAKAAIDQSQMVPVVLNNGQTVMVPARTAGGVASQQQGYSARRQQIEDHRKRWEQMGSHEAAQDAQRLFNSGAADDNGDLKDEIVRRMGLPPGTRLPNHDKGQVQVGEDGNFILINPRSGETKPVLQPRTADDVPVPQGSMQGTMEKGRQRRFNQGEAGKDRRVGIQQAGANSRASMRGAGVAPDRAATRRAAELVGKIETARQAIASADERLKRDPNNSTAKKEREAARMAGEGWATELNALNAGYEAGAGAQGYPYYKKSGQQQAASQPTAPRAGRTIEGAIEAFRKKTQRDPTPEEVNKMKAALGQ